MRSTLVCGIVIYEEHEATQTKNKLTNIMSSQLELDENNFGDNQNDYQEFVQMRDESELEKMDREELNEKRRRQLEY